MPSYGQFDTLREVARTGLGSVWSAKPRGGSVAPGQEKHAVKIREAIEDFVGAERAKELIDDFLGRAEAQIAAKATSGAADWGNLAPIYEKGTCDDGAYVVSDLYTRSARWLAASRVPMTGASLARITGGVLGALRQYEKGGRVHGNLKPANVFLTGSDDLAVADIRVDDPAAKAGLSDAERSDDVAELGKIIFLLVTGKPFKDLFQLPRDTSPEWQQLAEAETIWRKLCFDLINPEGKKPTLDEIQARITQSPTAAKSAGTAAGAEAGAASLEFQIAPVAAPKGKGKLIAIAAVVGIVGIGVAVMALGDKKPEDKKLVAGGGTTTNEPPKPEIPPDPRETGWVEKDDPRLMTELAAEIKQAEALTGTPLAERTAELSKLIEEFKAKREAIKLMPWTETPESQTALKQSMEELKQLAAGFEAPKATFSADLKVAQKKQEKADNEKLDGVKFLDKQRQYLADGDYLFSGGPTYSFNVMWAKALDGLIAAPPEKLSDVDKKARGQEIRDGLSKLEGSIPSPVDAKEPYAELVNAKRAAVLDELVGKVPLISDDFKWQPDQKKIDEVLGSFTAYNNAVDQAYRDGTRVASMIGQGGFALGEDAQPGKTLDRVWKDVEEIPVFAELLKDQALMSKAPEINQAAGLISQLRSINAYSDATKLEGVLADAAASPSAGATAWVALGKALPTNARADLARHIAAHTKLVAMAARIPDQSKAADFVARADAALGERWTQAFVKASDLASVSGLLADRVAAKVTPKNLDSLPAASKYNILLGEFVATNTRLSAPTQRRELTAEKDTFLAAVAALPSEITGDPGVSATISGLRAIFEGQKLPKVEDFAAMGPGRLAGWTPKVDGAEFETVSYTYTPARRNATPVVLTFNQIKIDATGEVTYIQSTELSIEQANAIALAAGRTSGIAALIPKDTDRDTRFGVRAWAPGTAATTVFQVAPPSNDATGTGGSWWTFSPYRSGPAPFPADLTVAPPKVDVPMQQAPLRMLLTIAASAGCRVPTVAEFERAVQAEGGWATGPTSNLRDQAWSKQHQYVRAMTGTPQEYSWPDLGAFVGKAAVPSKVDAVPAVDSDDKALWFWGVEEGGGSRFKNLIGNVSEMVLTDASGWVADDKPADAVKAMASKLSIMGGSAISPKEIPIDKPTGLVAADIRDGPADVGCRLAFPGLQVVNISQKMGDVLKDAKVVARQ
jgi:hypothetical protein